LLAKTQVCRRRKEIKEKSILNIYHRKDGSLLSLNSSRHGLWNGEEAIRVIKLSPQIPGTVDNKPVRVEYSLPITIQTEISLSDNKSASAKSGFILLQTKN
jgi:hypothetical protein